MSNDRQPELPGMPESPVDPSRQSFTINGHFLKSPMGMKGDVAVQQFLFETPLSCVTDEPSDAIRELLGKAVSITVKSLEYGRLLASKGREIADRDARAATAEDADPDSITLPPIEIKPIGDYLNADGDRITVVEEEGEFTLDIIAGGPKSKVADLDFPNDMHPTEQLAREALKQWCEVERGYKPVAPEGYGTVWGKGDPIVSRIAQDDNAEGNRVVFTSFSCKPDGTDAKPIKTDEIGEHEYPLDAQAELDAWAEKNELSAYGYIALESVSLPLEEDAAEQTLPAICYQNTQDPPHRLSVDRTPTDTCWSIRRERDGEETTYLVLSNEDDKTFDLAQTALNRMAEQNGFTPIMSDEPEPNIEDALAAGPTEGEVPEEPVQTPSDLAAQDAGNIGQVHTEEEAVVEPEPEAAEEAIVTPELTAEIAPAQEEPVAEEAPVEEAATEAVEEATEQAPAESPAVEAEAEPTTDPFEDGKSLACLYDLLFQRCEAGDHAIPIVKQEKFRTVGARTGPSTVTAVAPDRGGVKVLGKGMITAEVIDAEYEIYAKK